MSHDEIIQFIDIFKDHFSGGDGLCHAGWHGTCVHHADHGSQYLSLRYSECLADLGIRASTGTVGDSYDNALAETINGLL